MLLYAGVRSASSLHPVRAALKISEDGIDKHVQSTQAFAQVCERLKPPCIHWASV